MVCCPCIFLEIVPGVLSGLIKDEKLISVFSRGEKKCL